MKNYKDELLGDVIKLVQINSVRAEAEEGKPFGAGPAEALDFCLKLGEKFGFKVKNAGGRAGHIEYGDGDRIVAVLAHCDVVPAGDGWTLPPFAGVRKDNRIYGRGTMDDKGPAVAAIYCLKALKDMNITPKCRIRVIIGASEECGMEDMDYYFAHEELPDMAFTPDGEYPICNREKGIMHIKLNVPKDGCGAVLSFKSGNAPNIVPVFAETEIADETGTFLALLKEAAGKSGAPGVSFDISGTDGKVKIKCSGKSAHASTPEEGLNAAGYLISLLTQVIGEGTGTFYKFLNEVIGTGYDGAGFGVKCDDRESGPLTLNLGMVDDTGATLDIRYPVTKKGPEIFAAIESKSKSCGITASLISDSEPLFVPESSPLIKKLAEAYKTATDKNGKTYSSGGGSYARSLQNRGVAFGAGIQPLSYNHIHGADEFLEIEDFMLHCEICLQAIYTLGCE